MAYLSFDSNMITDCQPTVVMILNWLKREFKAKIEVYKMVPLGNCTYRITPKDPKDLPDKQICLALRELVPGVVIIDMML